MERLKEEAARHERTVVKEKRELQDRRLALEYEAECAEEERVRAVVEKIELGLKAMGEPPKERKERWDALRQTLREARDGTTLAARRLDAARSLKKGDPVYVPKLDGVFEVRKINKAKELLTVDARGVPAEISFQDISWTLPPGHRA